MQTKSKQVRKKRTYIIKSQIETSILRVYLHILCLDGEYKPRLKFYIFTNSAQRIRFLCKIKKSIIFTIYYTSLPAFLPWLCIALKRGYITFRVVMPTRAKQEHISSLQAGKHTT